MTINLNIARELYKSQNGRYPWNWKLETIISKLVPVTEEQTETPWVWTIDKLFNAPIKPIVADTKVRKMTTRIYNARKAKWLI